MLSTGDFFAAKYTGKNVAIRETTSETPKINKTFKALKFRSCNPITPAKDLLSSMQRINEPITDSTKQIIVMINASAKNILKTSDPLAPTARNTPMSLRFAEIDAEIKLNSISAENTPITSAIIKNIFCSCFMELTKFSSLPYTALLTL